jgi:hypothetical protein
MTDTTETDATDGPWSETPLTATIKTIMDLMLSTSLLLADLLDEFGPDAAKRQAARADALAKIEAWRNRRDGGRTN